MTRSSSKDHSGISHYSCVSFDRKSTVTRSFKHPDYASYGVIHQTTLGTTPVAHIRLDLEQRMSTRQPGSTTQQTCISDILAVEEWGHFSLIVNSVSRHRLCSLLVTKSTPLLKTSKHFLVLFLDTKFSRSSASKR